MDDKPDKPKHRRTRAAAAAEEEDDPELMAAAMREALEEMAGEEDGTSAQMLQLIRENLEEALTGEYAEELREALRKAGVEDALGVFEDLFEENLGDLIEDDDEVEEPRTVPCATPVIFRASASSSWPTSGAALPLARLVVPLRAERRPPARLGHAVGLRLFGDADPDARLAVPGGRRARRV